MSQDIERARSALWSLDPGHARGKWVKSGMAAKAEGLTFEDFHEWSAGAANYKSEADCRSAWDSFKDGAIGGGTLFYMAREAGWKDGSPRPFQSAPASPFKWANKPTESHPVAPKKEAEGQPQGKDPAAIWGACKPAMAAHWYIAKKGGNPDGLRVHSCGALVLPVYNLAGELASLQFIQADGRKVFLSGAKLPADGCLIIGQIEAAKPVYLVEGIGQAWSANKATGCAAVICFGWGRVAKVASAIKATHPAARLVIVPDAGKEAEAETIAAKVGGAWVEMPPGSPRNADINDIEQAEGVEAVRGILNAPKEKANPLVLRPITLEELQSAKLTPRVILENLLYADVRIRAAAGGTGKTTLALFEAVTLALGRELWGRMPSHPCKAVIVTREDGRETLTARMRKIIEAMNLAPAEVGEVLARVHILDVSGISFRLSTIENDLVEPHAKNIGELVASLSSFAPDWIIFDPLVSFGVGEGRVNDAEQGLIEAFRVLRNRLNCCIEGIHHVGKANAREKAADQYAARGGSALPDGSRMMAIMNPLTPDEWHKETGTQLAAGEDGIVMALPKLSYSPQQAPIFIRRKGYLFEQAAIIRRTKEQAARAIEEQVYQFILFEFQQGRKYSNQDLENSKEKMGLSRAEIRSAVSSLKVEGRIVYFEVKGKSGSHWQPVTLAADDGDTQPQEDDFSAFEEEASPG